MAQAFVIRPLGAKRDPSGRKIDFDRIQKELITPAMEAVQLTIAGSGDLVDAGGFRDDVLGQLLSADIVVCDITLQDANVFYQLGIRHALRRGCTVLIKGQPTDDAGAFEHSMIACVTYEIGSPAAARDRLAEMLQVAVRGDSIAGSPVFAMLPTCPELGAVHCDAVPAEFGFEVERAALSQERGWLGHLCTETLGRRFELQGLAMIARAQQTAGDLPGAMRSWEGVRRLQPDDIEANLALANLHVNFYRESNQPELLENSDQCLFRVLKCDRSQRRHRVEALALSAQNHKLRWRLDYEFSKERDERRARAMNRAALRSFECYREAFLQDLNHFYPGLAALQMGTILVDLSAEDAWFDAFDSDAEAEAYKRRLVDQMSSLQKLVPASLEADLERMRKDDSERVWAEICAADVLFLTTEGREQRVVSAYLHAVPLDKPQACEAVRRQMDVFTALDVRAVLANKVLQALAERFPAEFPGEAERRRKVGTLRQVVLVLTDTWLGGSGRGLAFGKFSSETDAKALLSQVLDDATRDADRVTVYASGFGGFDLLSHEIAAELGLASVVCLPVHKVEFAHHAFTVDDPWRPRFNEVVKASKILELGETLELPRWLQGGAATPIERYGRWLIELLKGQGAERTTVIVCADSKEQAGKAGLVERVYTLLKEQPEVEIVSMAGAQSTRQIA